MLVGAEKFELGHATKRSPHAHSLQPRRHLRPDPTGSISPHHAGALIAADTSAPPLSNIPNQVTALSMIAGLIGAWCLVLRPGHLVDAYCKGILAYGLLHAG